MRRAAMRLPSGRRFTIVADGLGAGRPYVGRVTLNGRPLTRSYLRHAEIMAGGELRFTMQAEPNRGSATAPKDRPFSASVPR